MKFTFEDWGKIKHALEVARREYEKQMNDSKESDEHTSCYQIFKRQITDADRILHNLATAEI